MQHNSFRKKVIKTTKIGMKIYLAKKFHMERHQEYKNSGNHTLKAENCVQVIPGVWI